MIRVVVTFALLDDVELVEPAAGESRGGVPVAVVGADVVVQQQRLEVVRANPPIHSQIQHKIRRHILPSAIAHPPY